MSLTFRKPTSQPTTPIWLRGGIAVSHVEPIYKVFWFPQRQSLDHPINSHTPSTRITGSPMYMIST